MDDSSNSPQSKNLFIHLFLSRIPSQTPTNNNDSLHPLQIQTIISNHIQYTPSIHQQFLQWLIPNLATSQKLSALDQTISHIIPLFNQIDLKPFVTVLYTIKTAINVMTSNTSDNQSIITLSNFVMPPSTQQNLNEKLLIGQLYLHTLSQLFIPSIITKKQATLKKHLQYANYVLAFRCLECDIHIGNQKCYGIIDEIVGWVCGQMSMEEVGNAQDCEICGKNVDVKNRDNSVLVFNRVLNSCFKQLSIADLSQLFECYHQIQPKQESRLQIKSNMVQIFIFDQIIVPNSPIIYGEIQLKQNKHLYHQIRLFLVRVALDSSIGKKLDRDVYKMIYGWFCDSSQNIKEICQLFVHYSKGKKVDQQGLKERKKKLLAYLSRTFDSKGYQLYVQQVLQSLKTLQ